MAILRFRVYWEEDEQTYRDIEIEGHQSFLDFHACIVKAFEFDGKHGASFYVSNDRWEYGKEISSHIASNKKDAPALSMAKTPVSALLSVPDQKFMYVYNPEKNWVFMVELLHVSKDATFKRTYPFILRSEGIAPAQYGLKGVTPDKLLEIEEKYEVGAALDGFSSDDGEGNAADDDEATEDNNEEASGTDFVDE